MVALGEFIDIGVFNIFLIVRVGFIVQPQSTAGSVTNRPFGTLDFGRFAAAVTGSADLGPEGGRQLRRVDDRKSFVEDRLFR